jgi:hypothetical protein
VPLEQIKAEDAACDKVRAEMRQEFKKRLAEN